MPIDLVTDNSDGPRSDSEDFVRMLGSDQVRPLRTTTKIYRHKHSLLKVLYF